MPDLYAVLTDMAQHPQMYSVSTMAELKSFVDGYRFGVAQGDSREEIPPFRQFSEWLVRKLQRGDTSLGWWQLIKWNDTEDGTAIREFGVLIADFAKRTPVTVAALQTDSNHHAPTGRYKHGVVESGTYVDLTEVLPHSVRITKYNTDDGVYLEYAYEQTTSERYCPSVLAATEEAFADFRIDKSAWPIQPSD